MVPPDSSPAAVPFSLSPGDRRDDTLDRRRGRRGGRRLTDRRPDIVHGLLCQACDVGIMALVDSRFADQALALTYRCPVCANVRVLTTDRYEAIREHLYWQAHQLTHEAADAEA